MSEPRRLRVGRHHGVTIVEHAGDADRGYLVGTVIPGARLPVEAAHALAQEICDAVNAAREAREFRQKIGRTR